VRRVYRDGRALRGDRVVVILAPGGGGVATVAGRTVGGAVHRNRARRIIRAAFREVAPSGLGDRDVVLVARPSIRDATSTELAEELRDLFDRVGSAS
jgi:ribonuclease P protein component